MKTSTINKWMTSFTAVLLAVGMTFFVVACGNKRETSQKTLIVGTTMTIDTLNRLDASGGAPGYAYDILASSLTQLSPIYFAERSFHAQVCDYAVSNDGKTYSFTVRNGYKWHDGVSVTAADVAYTFERSDLSFEYIDVFGNTVNVVLRTPNPRFLGNVAVMRLIPKHVLEGKTKETVTDAESVLGCGPFRFVSRNRSNNTIEFSKVMQYPYASEISFDKVIVKSYGTSTVMDLALKSEEIDLQYNYGLGISADSEADYEMNENIGLTTYPTAGITKAVFFNGAKNTDVNVKRAIRSAIDYNNVRNTFGTSRAKNARTGFVSDAVFGYSETELLHRDLEQAKALLTAEGYTSGSKYHFELLTRADNNDSQYADLIKTQLEETGLIEVNVLSKSKNDWQTYYQSGNHTACLGSVTAAGVEMQAGLCTKYFMPRDSEELAKNPVCYGNNVFEKDGVRTEFGKKYDALATAINEKEYLAAAKAYQEYMADNVSAIALYYDNMTQAYRKGLSGFQIDGNYGIFNVKSFETLKKA